MTDVVPISEAKANLSKLVKRANAGEVIYLGAYGRPDAILAPVPPSPQIKVGVWQERRAMDFEYDDSELIEPDGDVTAVVEQSINRSLA